jgi:hypothetical protein
LSVMVNCRIENIRSAASEAVRVFSISFI